MLDQQNCVNGIVLVVSAFPLTSADLGQANSGVSADLARPHRLCSLSAV